MANKRGKINLDITSILLALLENLASIDLDLKRRYFYVNSNINKELFFYRQQPRLKPFLEENVWSSQVLLKYANNQTETFVCRARGWRLTCRAWAPGLCSWPRCCCGGSPRPRSWGCSRRRPSPWSRAPASRTLGRWPWCSTFRSERFVDVLQVELDVLEKDRKCDHYL